MKRSAGDRLFSALLWLYPPDFRAGWGEEMRALFAGRLARAPGWASRARLRVGMVADIVINGIALRRQRRRSDRRREGTGMLRQEFRQVARQLIRTPLFTAGAVLLLAVGIGANTAVFTLVDALLFRPPPFTRPEEVVNVYQDSDDGAPGTNSFPAFRELAVSEAFVAVAATSAGTASWERQEGPVDVAIEFATSGYLEVLGLSPVLGRWFAPEEDVPGAGLVAVVSEPAWRTRLGSDPDVVGRTIRLNGQAVTIVGVGPRGLSGTYAPLVTDFWLSISTTPVGGPFRVANLERNQDHWYEVRARLAPGVTVEQAQVAMNGVAKSLEETWPELDRGRGITVLRSADVRLTPGDDGRLRSAATLLGAIVLTLLLLASANLANLLLARAIGRTGEVAVRRALGASLASVVRLMMLESLLLAAAGGALGLVLGRWALSVLSSLPLPPLSTGMELPLDLRTVAFAVGLMALTGIAAGLAPALGSARQELALVLRDDRRAAPTGRGTVRFRNILVAVQVAGSLVLVLGAGLFARSLAALQDVGTGLAADRVAWVRTSFAQAGLQGPETAVMLDEILGRIAGLPGVTGVAAASRLPAEPGATSTMVIDGYTPPSGMDAVELAFTQVTPAYFETLGLPLISGRAFTASDADAAQGVVIVNESAARLFWGGADPLGRRLRSQGAPPDRFRTAVGVVGDAPVNSLGDIGRPLAYVPMPRTGVFSAVLLARAESAPGTLLAPVRREVQAVRSTLPVLAQGTLESWLHAAAAGPRFAARLMGGVSILAMVLAGLGTYAVVAFGVARRSAELGIRMALGAGRGQVVRMVIGETVGTVVAGLAVGLALAYVVAPRLEPVLFGVRPLDPPTLAGAALLLLGVAGLAAWLPARRAARADPVRSLRAS